MFHTVCLKLHLMAACNFVNSATTTVVGSITVKMVDDEMVLCSHGYALLKSHVHSN